MLRASINKVCKDFNIKEEIKKKMFMKNRHTSLLKDQFYSFYSYIIIYAHVYVIRIQQRLKPLLSSYCTMISASIFITFSP
jgi:hypothetical protein